MLRLHVLELDGIARAALYCFHKGPRTCYYLGGFEPTLAKLSLGTVLTGRAIRHAIESDGASEFDFLRGDEPYKYKWGALDRKNARLVKVSSGGGRLLAALGKRRMALELMLKHRMHAAHGGGKKRGNG
jgi:CelD/BcsL family acetyltransferase involved in cellulose biosynthesis